MPRTRDLMTYPNRQFIALVKRVLESGPLTVPCTRAEAASMRGEIYAWRRACEENRIEAMALGVPVDSLRELAFRINASGLEAILAADLRTPSLIEAALGGTPPIKTEAQRSLERFLAETKGQKPEGE